jgi:transmembrane sensor
MNRIMTEEQPDDHIKIPDFVAEFLTQPVSFNKEIELMQWLQENPGHQRLLDEYLDIWQGSLKGRRTNDYDEHEAWIRFRNSMKIVELETGRQSSLFNRMGSIKGAIAAALVAFLLILSGFAAVRLYYTIKFPVTFSECSVPYGSKSTMALPDGSKVWLNAGSKIVFNSQYGTRNRELFLEGEAHFTVAPAKPTFRIKTASLTVEAAGTVFNLKAYPEEKTIETTVEEGIVYIFPNLSGKAASQKTVVKVNQKATFSVMEGLKEEPALSGNDIPNEPSVIERAIQGTERVMKISIAENIKPAVYSSWKDERWIIEREELQHLAKKLERRYNVRISFKNESLKFYVFSGILKDETLEQVLDYIKHTAPIGFEIQRDQVTLYEINALKSRLNK